MTEAISSPRACGIADAVIEEAVAEATKGQLFEKSFSCSF